jgi:hypothetical protein
MSSSSSTNVNKNKKSMVPTAIFPTVVYPVVSGSPEGNNSLVENTIANAYEKAFQKQLTAKEKAVAVAALHHDTRQRIVQYLAPPTSHHNPLHLMPVEQLESQSDSELVRQALAFLTIKTEQCDCRMELLLLSKNASRNSQVILNQEMEVESASSQVKKLTN